MVDKEQCDCRKGFCAVESDQWDLNPGYYCWKRSLTDQAPPDDDRPSRHDVFLEIASVLRKRSTCRRGKVGCVIVKDRRIIASGYNGAPPGAPHCFELGCDVDDNNHELGCQRTIHAEANAIAWAARAGQSTQGSILYSTHGPCLKCAQLIASAGIEAVWFIIPYRRPEGLQLLDELEIAWVHHGGGVSPPTAQQEPPPTDDGVTSATGGSERTTPHTIMVEKDGSTLDLSEVFSPRGYKAWARLMSRPPSEWTVADFGEFSSLAAKLRYNYGPSTTTLQL